MKLLKEIYETLLDWVKDLRETRKQLIWMATFLFMWSVIHGVDTITLGIIAGLLTVVWTFYFAGKQNEEKLKHEKHIMENTKVVAPSHNPDEE